MDTGSRHKEYDQKGNDMSFLNKIADFFTEEWLTQRFENDRWHAALRENPQFMRVWTTRCGEQFLEPFDEKPAKDTPPSLICEGCKGPIVPYVTDPKSGRQIPTEWARYVQ